MNIREFLEKQEWIFAKTYANTAPHEYCLLKKVIGTQEEFKAVARYIKQHGVPAYYWTVPRNYLFIEDKIYWVMDKNPDDAILINRCNVADYDITVKWRGSVTR